MRSDVILALYRPFYLFYFIGSSPGCIRLRLAPCLCPTALIARPVVSRFVVDVALPVEATATEYSYLHLLYCHTRPCQPGSRTLALVVCMTCARVESFVRRTFYSDRINKCALIWLHTGPSSAGSAANNTACDVEPYAGASPGLHGLWPHRFASQALFRRPHLLQQPHPGRLTIGIWDT